MSIILRVAIKTRKTTTPYHLHLKLLTKKPKAQNNQINNQAKNIPKKNSMNHYKYAIITLYLLVDFLTLKNVAPPLSPDDIGAQLPPLPLLLNKMYQKLLSIRHVALILLTSLQPPNPNWYKPYLTYEHHVGIARHNFHTCNAFKKNLIRLIKYELITFEEAPNVNTNPLPNHPSSNGSVNTLESG